MWGRLGEALEEDYLEHRIALVAYLGNQLTGDDVPIMQPRGGHAVYVDVGEIVGYIPRKKFPANAFVAELYLDGAIRALEIGALSYGEHAALELVRLAIPRRVYTQTHMDYVIDAVVRMFEHGINSVGCG